MNLQQYHHWSHMLQTRLAADPHVLGLVALGSYAQEELLDTWSDHDFWVITTLGAHESFLNDVSWLPNVDEIVVALRATPHYYTILYRNGHQVEFGVFDRTQLDQAKTNRYRMVFDKDDVSESVAACYQRTQDVQAARDVDQILAYLLITLCVGVARYQRGERLSAHQYVFGYALGDLLMLVTTLLPPEQRPDILDGFDPRRRFEQAYPVLAQSMTAILEAAVPQAALHIFALTERLFRATLAAYPRQGADAVLAYLQATVQGNQSG